MYGYVCNFEKLSTLGPYGSFRTWQAYLSGDRGTDDKLVYTILICVVVTVGVAREKKEELGQGHMDNMIQKSKLGHIPN